MACVKRQVILPIAESPARKKQRQQQGHLQSNGCTTIVIDLEAGSPDCPPANAAGMSSAEHGDRSLVPSPSTGANSLMHFGCRLDLANIPPECFTDAQHWFGCDCKLCLLEELVQNEKPGHLLASS